MKRMLINATQQEELRVALVDGQKLYDLDIETPSREQKKANIYKGKITRVEPSLEAAFVDYGAERHGFLPFKEITKQYFNAKPNGNGNGKVREGLREGQEIMVQVDKEERGNKGAALTTYISLAGRYLVLMPNNPRAGGVSRRIEGEDRQEIREILNQLNIPSGMGMIVRTAGVGRSMEEIQWDLDYLLQVWESVQKAAETGKAPFLVYQESNIIIRALRDYFRTDIGEILVDNPEVYRKAQEFVQQVMPQYQQKVKLYQDHLPLFTRFQIESQIETAFQREVALPSGGALVIDYTEALVSIDINSARATKGSDIEETALNTNLEAADEISRQLRLRDLGGLIVIDFIDMAVARNQREVENRLREALKMDRARVQLGRISRFGLLEMSRQRLRSSLDEASHVICPRCNGHGTIRSVQSLALAILRLIEEEAMKDRTGRVIIQAPVKVATFLLNEKRAALSAVEERYRINVVLIPNETLETPHFRLGRQRAEEVAETQDLASYNFAERHEDNADESPDLPQPKTLEEPLVKSIQRSAPAPAPSLGPEPASAPLHSPVAESAGGFLRWLWRSLFVEPPTDTDAEQTVERPATSGTRGSEERREGGSRSNRGRRSRSGPRTEPRTETAQDEDITSRGPNRRRDEETTTEPEPAQEPETETENRGDSSDDNGEGAPNRRRGRRGGRRRRKQENAETGEEAAASTGESRKPRGETTEEAQPQQADEVRSGRQTDEVRAERQAGTEERDDDDAAPPRQPTNRSGRRIRGGRPRLSASEAANQQTDAPATEPDSRTSERGEDRPSPSRADMMPMAPEPPSQAYEYPLAEEERSGRRETQPVENVTTELPDTVPPAEQAVEQADGEVEEPAIADSQSEPTAAETSPTGEETTPTATDDATDEPTPGVATDGNVPLDHTTSREVTDPPAEPADTASAETAAEMPGEIVETGAAEAESPTDRETPAVAEAEAEEVPSETTDTATSDDSHVGDETAPVAADATDDTTASVDASAAEQAATGDVPDTGPDTDTATTAAQTIDEEPATDTTEPATPGTSDTVDEAPKDHAARDRDATPTDEAAPAIPARARPTRAPRRGRRRTGRGDTPPAYAVPVSTVTEDWENGAESTDPAPESPPEEQSGDDEQSSARTAVSTEETHQRED